MLLNMNAAAGAAFSAAQLVNHMEGVQNGRIPPSLPQRDV